MDKQTRSVTPDQHWHLTTVEARAEFEQQHAGIPVEDWPVADIEASQNLALARRYGAAA